MPTLFRVNNEYWRHDCSAQHCWTSLIKFYPVSWINMKIFLLESGPPLTLSPSSGANRSHTHLFSPVFKSHGRLFFASVWAPCVAFQCCVLHRSFLFLSCFVHASSRKLPSFLPLLVPYLVFGCLIFRVGIFLLCGPSPVVQRHYPASWLPPLLCFLFDDLKLTCPISGHLQYNYSSNLGFLHAAPKHVYQFLLHHRVNQEGTEIQLSKTAVL